MLELITAPAELPVTRDEAKLYARIDADITADDALIDSLINAATYHAEHHTDRALISQAWRLNLSSFPAEICLPKGKAISVDAIKYLDENGAEQTLDPGEYQTNLTDDTGGLIKLAPDKIWPDIGADYYNPVRVEFTAGIAADAASLPDRVKVAIKTHITHMYEVREELVIGVPAQVIPRGYDRLLREFVIVKVQ